MKVDATFQEYEDNFVQAAMSIQEEKKKQLIYCINLALKETKKIKSC